MMVVVELDRRLWGGEPELRTRGIIILRGVYMVGHLLGNVGRVAVSGSGGYQSKEQFTGDIHPCARQLFSVR